ncbi:MAG: hypothetical protein ACTS10_05890 [Kiloniellales bacterium]
MNWYFLLAMSLSGDSTIAALTIRNSMAVEKPRKAIEGFKALQNGRSAHKQPSLAAVIILDCDFDPF